MFNIKHVVIGVVLITLASIAVNARAQIFDNANSVTFGATITGPTNPIFTLPIILPTPNPNTTLNLVIKNDCRMTNGGKLDTTWRVACYGRWDAAAAGSLKAAAGGAEFKFSIPKPVGLAAVPTAERQAVVSQIVDILKPQYQAIIDKQKVRAQQAGLERVITRNSSVFIKVPYVVPNSRTAITGVYNFSLTRDLGLYDDHVLNGTNPADSNW